MRAGGACGRGSGVRPFRPRANGEIARCEIDNGRGNEERRDAPGPVFQQVSVLALDNLGIYGVVTDLIYRPAPPTASIAVALP